MHTRTVRLVILLLGVLAVGLTGCDPEITGDPIQPGQISFFTVTIQPARVVERLNGTYTYTVIIEEVFGVGADIESITVESMQGDTVLNRDNWNQRRVRLVFGASRLDAFGRLASNITIDDCFGCNLQNWLVRANDDRGNHVEYAGTVELVSR